MTIGSTNNTTSSNRNRGLQLLAVGLAGATIGVLTIIACNNTSDPRAGTSTSSSGANASSTTSSSGSTSSGGIDAAPPAGPIECGPAPGTGTSTLPPITKQALLTSASQCAAWHACNFLNSTTTLRTTVRDHAAAPSDPKRDAARSAWKVAMNEWSKMEMFQFGPIGSVAIDKYHGRGLRNFVHPWPDLNRCQVETQVVTKGYQQGWDVVFASSRGLFAIEYLLYYPGADTACLPNSTAAQKWATQTPAELTAAKNDYSIAIVDNLAALAVEIRNVWAADGENFTSKLLAFDGYGSEQETLNVIAWSLLYPEQEIKDLKLGSRAGFQPPEKNVPETPFAGVEVENMRTNLRTFRSLFQGCGTDGQGIGFDDWLIAVGQQQLAQDILATLTTAQTAADAFPPFSQATPAQFVDMYNAIKPLSNLLKTSFFGSASTLNLKLPATAASDTD